MSRTRQNFPRVHATWQIENTRPRQTAFHRRRGNAEFFLRILAISSNVFLKSSRRSSPLAPWFKGAATFLTLLSEYRHAKHVDRDTFWWLKPLAPPSLPYPSISLHRISLSRFLRQWKALVQHARDPHSEIFKLQPGALEVAILPIQSRYPPREKPVMRLLWPTRIWSNTEIGWLFLLR